MNEYYGWLQGGIFCCDGKGYNSRNECVGKTEDLIKDHPIEKKEKEVYIYKRRRK